MTELLEGLRDELAVIRNQNSWRWRRILDSPQGVDVVVDGFRCINFAGNDYLGLANHPEINAALIRGAERWGTGAGAAHLVAGHSLAHHALEEELAEFTGRERVLLFSTGYMANLGVIAALAHRQGVVFEDRLNHASLLDGALLSGARLQRYAHGDVEALNSGLENFSGVVRLVVSDGVFSMDGDLAPLPELARISHSRGAWLIVDDAHGLGVLGQKGGGIIEVTGLGQDDVPVLVGTLGKAFGTFGAFVAGSGDLIDYLIQKARTYIYTTALPPAMAEASRTSLKLALSENWRRQRLVHLVQRFRTGAIDIGLNVMNSETPIQPVVLGLNETVIAMGRHLLNSGFLVGTIRPPTVPKGTARLRITLSAAHTDDHVDGLLDSIWAFMKQNHDSDRS